MTADGADEEAVAVAVAVAVVVAEEEAVDDEDRWVNVTLLEVEGGRLVM